MTQEPECNPNAPGAGDFRRAAALITHRASAAGQDLFDGVLAILQEASGLGRLTLLLSAVDTCYRGWIDQLRSERSWQMITELIDDVADHHADPYTNRAAIAIKAMREQDAERFVALMHEVNADGEGGSRLIGAVADVYSFILPELATPQGRADLGIWTLEIAKRDDGTE